MRRATSSNVPPPSSLRMGPKQLFTHHATSSRAFKTDTRGRMSSHHVPQRPSLSTKKSAIARGPTAFRKQSDQSTRTNIAAHPHAPQQALAAAGRCVRIASGKFTTVAPRFASRVRANKSQSIASLATPQFRARVAPRDVPSRASIIPTNARTVSGERYHVDWSTGAPCRRYAASQVLPFEPGVRKPSLWAIKLPHAGSRHMPSASSEQPDAFGYHDEMTRVSDPRANMWRVKLNFR